MSSGSFQGVFGYFQGAFPHALSGHAPPSILPTQEGYPRDSIEGGHK